MASIDSLPNNIEVEKLRAEGMKNNGIDALCQIYAGIKILHGTQVPFWVCEDLWWKINSLTITSEPGVPPEVGPGAPRSVQR